MREVKALIEASKTEVTDRHTALEDTISMLRQQVSTLQSALNEQLGEGGHIHNATVRFKVGTPTHTQHKHTHSHIQSVPRRKLKQGIRKQCMCVCVCVCVNWPYRAYRQGRTRVGHRSNAKAVCMCVCVCVCPLTCKVAAGSLACLCPCLVPMPLHTSSHHQACIVGTHQHSNSGVHVCIQVPYNPQQVDCVQRPLYVVTVPSAILEAPYTMHNLCSVSAACHGLLALGLQLSTQVASCAAVQCEAGLSIASCGPHLVRVSLSVRHPDMVCLRKDGIRHTATVVLLVRGCRRGGVRDHMAGSLARWHLGPQKSLRCVYRAPDVR